MNFSHIAEVRGVFCSLYMLLKQNLKYLSSLEHLYFVPNFSNLTCTLLTQFSFSFTAAKKVSWQKFYILTEKYSNKTCFVWVWIHSTKHLKRAVCTFFLTFFVPLLQSCTLVQFWSTWTSLLQLSLSLYFYSTTIQMQMFSTAFIW